MRNGIATASDAEILSTLNDLAKLKALESPHLMPQTQPVQQVAAPAQPIQQIQVVPQNNQQQLNAVGGATGQMQQMVQSPQNQNGMLQMPQPVAQQPLTTSLQNPSLNLQTLMTPTPDAGKQPIALNQATTQAKDLIGKIDAQNNSTKLLNNIQMPDEKETQHFLKAQQDEVANSLASEANAKLVKDLKTLSAVLEAKQNLKTQEMSDLVSNLNQKQPAVQATTTWQQPEHLAAAPNQAAPQPNLQVYPEIAKNGTEVAFPQVPMQVPAIAQNQTATQDQSGSWSLFGKKKSREQELAEKEETERKDLLKNATQSLDSILKQDSQSDAIKQMTTALGIEVMQHGSQAFKQDELFKNATSAIEGLINLRAEQIVKDKEEQKQMQELQQQIQQQAKNILPIQQYQQQQQQPQQIQQQIPAQQPIQQPIQQSTPQMIPAQQQATSQPFNTQNQPSIQPQMANQVSLGTVTPQAMQQQPQVQAQPALQAMQPAPAQQINGFQQPQQQQQQQMPPQQPQMPQRPEIVTTKMNVQQSTKTLPQTAQPQMVAPQGTVQPQQQYQAVTLQQEAVPNQQMQKMIQDYQQLIQGQGPIHQANSKAEQRAQEEKSEVPKQSKFIDFLSSAGKISTITLSATPLPTYLGAWGKPHREQVERVESIAFAYILLCILNNSIWTSYAFKIQNIDLAIISVIPLIIAVVLAAIYLFVKPESHLIKQFFIAVLLSQVFNFDLLSVEATGLMGTCVSVLSNMVPLSFMPAVIETRDVRGINMPLAVVNQVTLTIWATYAALILEPFMLTSQAMGWMFNGIQIMFFFWAKGKLNAVDTPQIYWLMRYLIKIFSLFVVQQKFKEMQQFFWQDESTEEAQVYIKQYKDDISALEQKYQGREKSFEEHLTDMRSINSKLEAISSGTYKRGGRRGADDAESEQSTQEGSWPRQQQSKDSRGQPYKRKQGHHLADMDFHGDQENQRYYDYQGLQIANNHFLNGGAGPHGLCDDSMSMNSFNSSINFVKLQNSINFRQTISNNSESTNYFKSRLHNVTQMQGQRYPRREVAAQLVNRQEAHPNDSTLILDDLHGQHITGGGGSQPGAPFPGSQMPKPVQEVSMEDEEQSDRCGQEARSSVASLLSMILPESQALPASAEAQAAKEHGQAQEMHPIERRGGNKSNDSVSYEGDNDDSIIYNSPDVARQMTKTKLEDLKTRAQKLKNQKKQKKNALYGNAPAKMSNSIEMDTMNKMTELQPAVKTDLDKTQIQQTLATNDQLNTFFENEKNAGHLEYNNIKDAHTDDEDEMSLIQGGKRDLNGSGSNPSNNSDSSNLLINKQ